MNYENRVVLFLDILGFRSIIENTIANDNDDVEAILKLYNNLEDIGNQIKHNLENEKLSSAVTQFSDSIVVSFYDSNVRQLVRLIKTVQALLVNLIGNGILCRGAISYGKLIHTNKVIFGPALNDAYETETKAALYPRVILDKSIIDLAKQEKRFFRSDLTIAEKSILRHLKKDSDEKYYVDYFSEFIIIRPQRINVQEYLQNLRTIISNGNKFKRPDLKVKYGWMVNKYNRLLHQLKKEQNRTELAKQKGLITYIMSLTDLS